MEIKFILLFIYLFPVPQASRLFSSLNSLQPSSTPPAAEQMAKVPLQSLLHRHPHHLLLCVSERRSVLPTNVRKNGKRRIHYDY